MKFLTQAKLDKRRSMQRGSRFAYALDFRKESANQLSEQHLNDESEIRLFSPEATLLASDTNNHNKSFAKSVNASKTIDGLRIFGNPTLETLKVMQ